MTALVRTPSGWALCRIFASGRRRWTVRAPSRRPIDWTAELAAALEAVR